MTRGGVRVWAGPTCTTRVRCTYSGVVQPFGYDGVLQHADDGAPCILLRCGFLIPVWCGSWGGADCGQGCGGRGTGLCHRLWHDGMMVHVAVSMHGPWKWTRYKVLLSKTDDLYTIVALYCEVFCKWVS